MMQSVVTVINELADHLHSIAESKGFYDVNHNLLAASVDFDTRQQLKLALDQASIARMHSELSEAVEAIRHGNPRSEKIPEFTNEEEELADCIIRILDYCGAKGYDIGGAIVAKSEYNEGRSYLHGKNS
jgi:NTP pyrophosphatase (non-canonical NTP hydrolase)